jgi:hypothetical protein
MKKKHSYKIKQNTHNKYSKKKYCKPGFKGGKLCKDVGVAGIKEIRNWKNVENRIINALSINPNKKDILIPNLEGLDYKIVRTPKGEITIGCKNPYDTNSYYNVLDLPDNDPICTKEQAQFGGLLFGTRAPTISPIAPIDIEPNLKPQYENNDDLSLDVVAAAPLAAASPLVSPLAAASPSDDDFLFDVTDKSDSKSRENYILESKAREEEDTRRNEEDVKIRTQEVSRVAGYVPFIRPSDFFQQLEVVQAAFNKGNTPPKSLGLTFLCEVTKYRAYLQPAMVNLFYELTVTPNYLPLLGDDYQTYLWEKDNFPVSVLLRCTKENGKVQVREVYAVTEATKFKQLKDGKYKISHLAKFQTKSDYYIQNKDILKENDAHIARLDARHVNVSKATVEEMKKRLVPRIETNEINIEFTPITPVTELEQYIRDNNKNSFSLTRLHLYAYEEPKIKSFTKSFSTKVKGGKKSKKFKVKKTRKCIK